MGEKPVVTVECDYGPTTLWMTPTDEQLADLEKKMSDPSRRWVPGSSGSTPNPWGGRLSDALLGRLDAWGLEWIENGGDWAESDLTWLQRGGALTNEVRQELGADYVVIYGYRDALRQLAK